MKIGVAGSVGLDHLMTFSGKFTDSLVAGSLEKVSLSFLVDSLMYVAEGARPTLLTEWESLDSIQF